MNEDQQNPNESAVEPVETQAPEAVTEAVETTSTVATDATHQRRKYIVIAIGVVLVLFLGLLYLMETTGRIDTGIFSGYEQAQLERQVVAEVNGETITGYDLAVSQEQIAAAATAQGVDVSDPDAMSGIREQAVEMLINTELLRQEAGTRGLSVTDEDVTARYDQLVAEVGGEEVLFSRMEEFGVTPETLQKDIKNELTIQVLLDEIFAEATIEVTDEEVAALYAAAGGAEGGLPPLAEVEEQIIAQIEATKEQEIVTNFVEGLRNQSEVNVLLEV